MEGKGLNVYAYADDLTSIAPGKAHVTVAHFAIDVGAVDVGVGQSTTLLAENLGYANFNDPVAVDAGAYTADVRGTGQTGTPLLSINVALEARKAYLVAAVGSADDSPNPAPTLIAFELTDYSINARLAFVHGVPAADLPVNVVANGDLSLFRNVK
jgi:hypothetical protein